MNSSQSTGDPLPDVPGRGSRLREAGRFERVKQEIDWEQVNDPDHLELLQQKVQTAYLEDASLSIVSRNDSPDLNFNFSLNPYRGCAHGCSYCYARPTHEYLGFGPGLDFESKIVVKRNAGELFRDWLMKRRVDEIEPVMLSGVTDCYQPAERDYRLTRECLAVALEFRHPVQLITKNSLILRDLDLIRDLAELNLVDVAVSVTTLDQSLARIMEPRTSSPESRLNTIAKIAANNIPVMAMLAPIIPAINDDEIPAILKRVREAGASRAGHIVLRLPGTVKEVFCDWLANHLPDRREKVLGRVRSLRDGQLNSSQFGERMKGTGIWSDQFSKMFKTFKKKYQLDGTQPKLSTSHFRKVDASGFTQETLF